LACARVALGGASATALTIGAGANRGLLAALVADLLATLGLRFVGSVGRVGFSSRERKPCRDPERPAPPAPFLPEPLFLMRMWVPERCAGGNQALSLPCKLYGLPACIRATEWGTPPPECAKRLSLARERAPQPARRPIRGRTPLRKRPRPRHRPAPRSAPHRGRRRKTS
jgi:hypothetical protein